MMDMDYVRASDYNNKQEEMIPFFSVSSRDFDRDMIVLKKVLHQFEQRTHSENAYIFSTRATMAAGWWFYDIFFKPDFVQKIFQLALAPDFPPYNKKAAAMKIVDIFQNQVKLNGSDARIKMYGDIPFATPWWSWLFR
jgi:hypothetical protein